MHEIVEDDRFIRELTAISGDIKRGDEFTIGVKWRLSRDPRSGLRISNNIWFVKTREEEIQGRVIVFYTFDDHKVYLLSIISLKNT